MKLRQRHNIVIHAGITDDHLPNRVIVFCKIVRHPLYKPDWRGIEKLTAIDTGMRFLINNIVLENMNEFVKNHLSERFQGSGEGYNDTVFKEFRETSNAFVKFLENYVGFLKVFVGFVKDERCSVLQFMFKIFAVLLVSFFGDSRHNRYEFHFTWVVVNIKMLCPVNVPIEALIGNLVFSKTLRPRNTR